jgi:acetyl esterase/lipase
MAADKERMSDGKLMQESESQVFAIETDVDGHENGKTFSARLITSKSLPIWKSDAAPSSSSSSSTLTSPNTLVVHFHGGGFIAMSSYSHQEYTRKWAQQTGYAILSVDYRLARDDPYPASFLDCWDAYNWALNTAHEYLGILGYLGSIIVVVLTWLIAGDHPDVILLTGDSAGEAPLLLFLLTCFSQTPLKVEISQQR